LSRVVLALETSCDETAVAILRGHGDVLSHLIASQADIHAQYGGVVPEVASRNHLAILPGLVGEALREAGLAPAAIDAFAATTGPGLAAALLVGSSAAKGLALGAGKTFLAVDHLEGHMLSPFFGESTIPPHVSLVVSGGHTLLFDVSGHGQYILLGRTVDDAAGEAFDKVAKMLGLGYPGGAEIDRLAREGDPKRFDFPRSMIGSGDRNFSFSGLKTSVRYLIPKLAPDDLDDVCASVQEAIVDILVEKTLAAARATGRSIIGVSGGVSCNSRLREKMSAACAEAGLDLRLASPALCTDNAAMIAFAASQQFRRGETTPLDCDIDPAWKISCGTLP